ncbi:hypothetical protein ABZZ36_42985, partial [Actinacidiphila glaucinigra]|uniref:SH3 domain-containing protein n=1 Tax=Actinacidiphila glaucinigra TaxID=235986 RepID=UPI003475E40D
CQPMSHTLTPRTLQPTNPNQQMSHETQRSLENSGQLYPSDRLTARCTKGSWFYVSTDTKTKTGIKAGTYGWVSASYLDIQTCTANAPSCPVNR